MFTHIESPTIFPPTSSNEINSTKGIKRQYQEDVSSDNDENNNFLALTNKKIRLLKPLDKKNFAPILLQPKQKSTTSLKIEIRHVDYENESLGKQVKIPGIEQTFSVDFLGKGKNHFVYGFREKGTIEVKSNDYFHFFKEGRYDLSKLVLKILNTATGPASQAKQIKEDIEALENPENLNPKYRTELYFYAKDGASLEQRVKTFEESLALYPEAFNKGLNLVKALFEQNVIAQRTVYFDIKPANIGFTDDERAVVLDRDSSRTPSKYIMEMSKDISEWMKHGKAEQATKAIRFSYLTSNFPEEIQKACLDQINTHHS